MPKSTKKTIRVGSGNLYYQEFVDTIPETDEICVEENRLSYIKNGASIEYTPEILDVKDDLGKVEKIIITTEEALFKSGLLTWNTEVLNVLTATGRVTEDKEKGLRTIKIGGTGNDNGKSYVLCFHHVDKKDGDIWIVIVGKNQSGFTLTFAADSESVIDAEFKCLPQDDEGTLIKYIEEIDKEASM
ncbi:MAG: hypothetical protein MR413_08775 [Clostridia bacterium]|nr:hypothetical protein [Clostridia bacterium]